MIYIYSIIRYSLIYPLCKILNRANNNLNLVSNILELIEIKLRKIEIKYSYTTYSFLNNHFILINKNKK